MWFKGNGEVEFGGRNDNCSRANYLIKGVNIFFSGNPCSNENSATAEALTDSENDPEL